MLRLQSLSQAFVIESLPFFGQLVASFRLVFAKGAHYSFSLLLSSRGFEYSTIDMNRSVRPSSRRLRERREQSSDFVLLITHYSSRITNALPFAFRLGPLLFPIHDLRFTIYGWLFAARVLGPGIYVVMHNQVFPVDRVRKDRSSRFVLKRKKLSLISGPSLDPVVVIGGIPPSSGSLGLTTSQP